MDTRKLGNSILTLTRVATAPGLWWVRLGICLGAAEDADFPSRRVIVRLELRQVIDTTAAALRRGAIRKKSYPRSEEGAARPLMFFTQCFLAGQKGNVRGIQRRFDPARIAARTASSACRSPRIDLYQIHWPPGRQGTVLAEAWQRLPALRKKAKLVDRRF